VGSLVNGTYTFSIVANNAVGSSAPAAVSIGPPTTPQSLRADAIGKNGVTTQFDLNAFNTSSYNLYWSTKSGVTPATGTKVVANANGVTYVAGLPAQLVYFIVTAVNGLGESPPSAQIAVKPNGPITDVLIALDDGSTGLPGIDFFDRASFASAG